MNRNQLKKLDRLTKEIQAVIDKQFKSERAAQDKENTEFLERMEQREKRRKEKKRENKG